MTPEEIRQRVRARPGEQRALVADLLRRRELLKGSLFVRFGVCWKEGCVCRTGQKHGPYCLADQIQRGRPKTAAIVLCFSLNMPAFPVDTHVYRVTGRIGLHPEKMSVELAHPHLVSLFPPETYYAAHLNLIHLGREICTARRPYCEKCPIVKLCDVGRTVLEKSPFPAL